MKRRILSVMLSFVMLCAFVPIMSVQAATDIEIGDYVQMGTYYGEPILWRCVDIDENGPLMLSDKIICLKPYDAGSSANTTTGSHSRRSYESNYWGDSNMRSWLNSSASAGDVTWLCGNPPDEDHVWNGYNEYDQEAGFLTNFSQSELNAVKEVTQKSILSTYDKSLDTTGASTYHTYEYNIADVVQNYNSCYAENITDKMFLLDVKQVNAVYNNRSVLGDDYYIGEPTEQCVANSEYKSSSLATGNKWYYWLRSPSANDYDSVRHVDSSGNVDSDDGYYGSDGVRPAFYLNLSSVIFKSGSGTESNPYTVEEQSEPASTPTTAPSNPTAKPTATPTANPTTAPVATPAEPTTSPTTEPTDTPAETPTATTSPETEIELSAVTEGNKICEVQAVNLEPQRTPLQMYVAQYDDNGVLISLNIVSISDSDAREVDINIVGKIKLMLWNYMQQPICEAAIYE